MLLGNKAGVLLKGHGIALTDSSLRLLVVRAYNLRVNARIQQQAIALGGKVTYLQDPPAAPSGPATDAAYNRGYIETHRANKLSCLCRRNLLDTRILT
jgi:hypothetical protein